MSGVVVFVVVVGLTLNIFVLGLVLFLDSRWEAVTSIVKPTRIPLLSDIPLVGPGLFIPLAEESGMIGALGEWIPERACTDLAR